MRARSLAETPAHSPLLALPVVLAFGLWSGQGMMHLLTMAAETLTICYCIDVPPELSYVSAGTLRRCSLFFFW